jgi:hypothetical protein
MNSSLRSAGRSTHLKILLVSIIASTIVVAVGINARVPDKEAVAVAKAEKSKTYTDSGQATVR